MAVNTFIMIREFILNVEEYGEKHKEYISEYSVGSFGCKEPMLMRELMKDVVLSANDDDTDTEITGFSIETCYDLELKYYEYVLHFCRGDKALCASYRGSDVGIIRFNQRTAQWNYNAFLL